jgi:hypothetical protein
LEELMMELAMSALAFGCALVLTLPAVAHRAKSAPAKATWPAAVGIRVSG